jgi:hypothetical protein
VDNHGNKGYMENPDNWEYVYTPMHPEDPNLVPQSLHRDQGYVLAAGWRKWEAGYVQRGVTMRANQRYILKAVFAPHVGFQGTMPDDWRTQIQWHWFIEAGVGQAIQSEWSSTTQNSFGHDEEHLFVVQSPTDLIVNIYFKARSRFASNACDFNIKSLTMEEVPGDYGQATFIGSPTTQPVTSPVTTTPQPSTQPTTTPTSGGVLPLSNEQIDVIAGALRLLADALQTLKK